MQFLLAQTSQPATGMKSWGPGEWSVFFVALGGFITLLSAQIVSIITSWRARADSTQALSNSVQNRKALQFVADAVDPSVPEKEVPGLAEHVRTLTAETPETEKLK